MIFITGDIHGDIKRFNKRNFPEQKEMNKDDYVIILGDFGVIWDTNETERENLILDTLENKNFTTLFLDGNHENFDRLNSYPVEEWNGGKVHKIRPSVIHLMRGQIYNLFGKKFFVFGGAQSQDIKDGVFEVGDPHIEKYQKDRFKLFRINHVSWWKEELPSSDEMNEGWQNLENSKLSVDYILTHDLPTDKLTLYTSLFGHFVADIDYLNNYLNDIEERVCYKKWFCGHHHDDCNVDKNCTILYNQIYQLD